VRISSNPENTLTRSRKSKSTDTSWKTFVYPSLSFVSSRAQIDHMASLCACVFEVHIHLPRTGHMHSGNDNRWYAHLYMMANQQIINDHVCNYMLTIIIQKNVYAVCCFISDAARN